VTQPGAHNLARLAEESLERLGDRDSLLFDGAWHRAGALHQRSGCIAGGLSELGLRPGDRVVVLMSNCAEVPLSYHALWRAGLVAVPAIFLLSEEDLHHIVLDSGARAVITTPEMEHRVQGAVRDSAVRHVIVAGEAPAGTLLSELEGSPYAPLQPRGDDDLAALMYTGGTTGRAKGVMLTHSNLWHSGKAGYENAHVPGLNRSLVSLPLSHAFGMLLTAIGMHAQEPGVVVLMRWFQSGDFLRLIQDERIQVAPVVPSMLQILLAEPLEDYDLSSLAYFASGASPLPLEVAREIERRLPGVQVREGYGLTESGGIATSNPPGARKLGSVGKPVMGCEVRILDEEGKPLPAGETGEICCSGPMVMAGYWNAPDATARAIVDGWLHTGDIGHLDQDGYLHVSDRKKDLIIRGGFNVFPRDVEDALLEHPAVAMAGVVGRPDRESGEEVVAFVALRPGADASAEELIDFGRRRLGGYKYPREVHIAASIPLTPVGKVDRKALRSLLARGAPTPSSPSA
jgi:long-chain acyl-CoA synthetase